MQGITLPPFIKEHKSAIVSLIGVVAFAALGVYLVYLFKSDSDAITVKSTSNQALLSQGFVVFLQAISSEKLSLKDTSFIDGYLIRSAKSYTQVIDPSISKGRVDPFTSYAASRSTR